MITKQADDAKSANDKFEALMKSLQRKKRKAKRLAEESIKRQVEAESRMERM